MFRSMLLVMLCWSGIASAFTLDASGLHGRDVDFIRYEGRSPFQSYLAMNLPYASFRSLTSTLSSALGMRLQNRGEAHVTVVTPVEVDEVLYNYVSIDEIGDIAESMGIQSASIQPICIGKGQVGPDLSYFVVVSSNDLLDIRREIERRYVARGGNPVRFEATHFYPHVTLGFTSRDLHEADGVIKDQRSCVYPLSIQ